MSGKQSNNNEPEVPRRQFMREMRREQIDGKFAVFRASRNGAKFSSLHDTFESAADVASAHAVEAVGIGSTDFAYYIVEIKATLGLVDGKFIDTRRGKK